jgi:type IV pilus assembly protein PilX
MTPSPRPPRARQPVRGRCGPHCARRQRGAVLVVGLIFLALLSLMAVAAYSNATLEEKMAGNTRDRIRAFEAAETSLRDCEALLGGLGALPTFNGTGGMYPATLSTELPHFETIDWKNDAAARVLSTPIAGVSRQPRCIVEEMVVLDAPPLDGAVSGPQQRVEEFVYRVSAVGFGGQHTTVALVQSTYRRQ